MTSTISSAFWQFSRSAFLTCALTNPGSSLPGIESGALMSGRSIAAISPRVQSRIRHAYMRAYRYEGGGDATGSNFEFPASVVDIESPNAATPRIRHVSEDVKPVAELIAHVRATFDLSIKDLAEILHVRRPTVYAWIEGITRPQRTNADRLAKIHHIANSWAKFSTIPLGDAVHAIDSKGISLLQMLRERVISERAILDRFAWALENQSKTPKPDERPPSIREILRRKGLRPTDESISNRRIDVLTGKRPFAE